LKFELTVHTALDELRMQMLGTQVLFGFQFQGVFQDAFDTLPPLAKSIALCVFGLLVATLGCLIAPAAQHRLVERGIATRRLFDTANRFAEVALVLYALAMGFDVFVVASVYWGEAASAGGAGAAILVAVLLLFGLGWIVRRREGSETMPERKEPELHEKIDQMLTEARVVLPGAQALLGFQFVVTLTKAFHALPDAVQTAHFAALACILLTVLLLISPAAVHRIAFDGQDADRMHDIGSRLVTLATVPLAAGIAIDVYVALAKVVPGAIPWIGGAASFALLATLWYVVPFAIRARQSS
jgi:uncharacterized protein (TIGR03382 family)